MRERSITPLMAIAPLCAALLLAPPASAQSRGEMLYSLHCIACHTTQMHWRDNKLATDWNSLKLQVRRWQGVAGQQWSDAEIADVAAYLNDSIYHFTPTGEPLSSLSPVFRSDRYTLKD
jgi:mono/diheme cytochrome c family protein